MKGFARKVLNMMLVLLITLTSFQMSTVNAFNVNDYNLVNTATFIDDFSFHEYTVVGGVITKGDPKYDFEHTDRLFINVEFSKVIEDPIDENSLVILEAPMDIKAFVIKQEDALELKSDDGVHYANVHTNADGTRIYITFENLIGKEVDYKGNFYIPAEARFANRNNVPIVPNQIIIDEYDTTLGINNSALSKDYTISYERGEGTGNFFSKPHGTIYTENPDHVQWWLHVNLEAKEFISDLRIEDTIRSGQEFVLIDNAAPVSYENLEPSKFLIHMYIAGESRKTLTPIQFVEQGYGTIEFNSDSELVMTFLKDAMTRNNEFMVAYQTKITREGKYQPKFYNDAIGYYKSINGLDVEYLQLDREAYNITSGGIIIPQKGTLMILKLAADGEETLPLAGVQFKIFNPDGREVQYLDSPILTTDENGIATTAVLREGKYYISEISAPDFVDFDPSIQYHFEIRYSATDGVTIVISNEIRYRDIEVTKIWKDDLTQHPDITVNLLADGVKIDSVVLTDSNLNHVFENHPTHKLDGTKILYEVEEVNVQGYDATIREVSDYVYEITNSLKPDFVSRKLTSDDIVVPNQIFEYTIQLENTVKDSVALKNILVEDTLPNNIHFHDNKVYVNGVETAATFDGNKVSLTIPELSYGEIINITFKVYADEDALGLYTNVATITYDDPDNPQTPEVDVVVTEDEEPIDTDPGVNEPGQDNPDTDKPEKPALELPATGLEYTVYLVSLLLVSLGTVLVIFTKREDNT